MNLVNCPPALSCHCWSCPSCRTPCLLSPTWNTLSTAAGHPSQFWKSVSALCQIHSVFFFLPPEISVLCFSLVLVLCGFVRGLLPRKDDSRVQRSPFPRFGTGQLTSTWNMCVLRNARDLERAYSLKSLSRNTQAASEILALPAAPRLPHWWLGLSGTTLSGPPLPPPLCTARRGRMRSQANTIPNSRFPVNL